MGMFNYAATGAAVGSAIPGVGTAIGAGAGLLAGLVGSLFSDDSEQSDAIKALLSRLQQVQGYSRSQIDRSVKSFDNAAMTTLASSVNNYAIGAADKQGMMNAAVAKLLPQVSMLGANRRAQMEDFNKNLEMQKIQTEAGLIGGLSTDTPQDDFFTTMSLAAQGAQLGGMISPTKSTSNEAIWNNWTPQTKNNFLENLKYITAGL